jgi:hypothetical protein
MILVTTTQLKNREAWSGCIKREGEGRVDGRFGAEAKEEDGSRDQETPRPMRIYRRAKWENIGKYRQRYRRMLHA